MTEFLLQNSKKRGRPKKAWTQKDTARDLGISQQAVSNCMQIAKAVKAVPHLVRFRGGKILKVLQLLRRENVADFSGFLNLDNEDKEIMAVIEEALGKKAAC